MIFFSPNTAVPGAALSAVWLTALASVGAAPDSPDTGGFTGSIEPILALYCYDCHGDGMDKGDFAMDDYETLEAHLADREIWFEVWKNIRSNLMPPADKKQLEDAEKAKVLAFIEREVFRIDPENPDPGLVTIRRLNREEYRNTVRDLFGIDFNTAEAFPPDDTGYGFDTIGDVLSISPLLMEKYLEAAMEIAAKAIPADGSPGPVFPDGSAPADRDGREKYREQILRRLATRAFRRPVDIPALERLMELSRQTEAQPGNRFDDGIRQALTAILASPRFLMRAEIQAEPDNPGSVAPLDEFALASRLSYFLWSSCPDDELLQIAGQGGLRANLRPQVDRMLADAKSDRFIRNFVGQWLHARDVETIHIDARRVLGIRDFVEAQRAFNIDLRRSMRQETELFFAHILRQNLPATELLTADYTFLNEALAKWYGVEGVQGKQMRLVNLPPEAKRGGLLRQGTFLVATSNPTRTSPVKRGLFVLENLLATPPPPTPPEVPPLEDSQQGRNRDLPLRDLLALHSEQKLCASCHQRMDPIGLALENYNAAGLWRDDYHGQPIDAAGKLITGESFGDAGELSRVLAESRRHDFHRALTEKLLTYAIGRGIEYYDAPSIDGIVRSVESDGGRLRNVVFGIVESAPFQKRRGDGHLLANP